MKLIRISYALLWIAPLVSAVEPQRHAAVGAAGAAAHYPAHCAARAAAADSRKFPLSQCPPKSAAIFPADFKNGFTRYHEIHDAEAGWVQLFYANGEALIAAATGSPLSDGAVIVVELHSAKLGRTGKALRQGGNLVPDRLLSYSVMSRGTAWRGSAPEVLRSEGWNYTLFTAERGPRTTMGRAECLACHESSRQSTRVFTLKQLGDASTGE